MNFVILGSPWDFYKVAYSEAIELTNVEYKEKITNNPILRILCAFHLHRGINKIITLPLKKIWSRVFINTRFPKDDNLCFIIFYNWVCLNISILETIKKIYPKAKTVVVFNDLIKVQSLCFTNTPLDIHYIKSLSDIVISFDFNESESYGLTYHPIPYSPALNTSPSDKKNMFDVYFLGQAKNRLDDILRIFYNLKRLNLKLKFILSNVPHDRRINEPEITYVDGIGISYQDNLDYVRNSKCLLEIMQKNGSGYTSRTLEAIAYGKKLLTNNLNIVKAPFYTPEYILTLTLSEDIQPSFNHWITDDVPINYNYIQKLSPIELLKNIESKFEK